MAIIPELTPDEIARCEAASVSTEFPYVGRKLSWRTVAQKLGISPQRVLKHFDPAALVKYQSSLKASPSKITKAIRQKERKGDRFTRAWSEQEIALIVKGYRSGMSPRWCSERLGDGIGRIMVAKVFATLGGEHGAAREAALAKPTVRDRDRWQICGLRPSSYHKRETPAHRPPLDVIADRDRRMNLRYQSLDPNVLILGDPVRG